MLTNKVLRDALVEYDGRVFEDREAVEDFVFPFFNRWQDQYHGKTFRDFTDALINKTWIKPRIGGGWVLVLPPAEEVIVPSVAPVVANTANLTFREIYMLVALNTVAFIKGTPGNKHVTQTLVEKGLVEYVGYYGGAQQDEERRVATLRLASIGTEALAAVATQNFELVEVLAAEAQELRRVVSLPPMVHQLTAAGRTFMDTQTDAIAEWPLQPW